MATPFTPRPGFRPNNNRFGNRGPVKKEALHAINERITSPMVRLVGDNTANDIVELRSALQEAERQGLDLVEISPTANPSPFISTQFSHL